jgi:hypothetical protein
VSVEVAPSVSLSSDEQEQALAPIDNEKIARVAAATLSPLMKTEYQP